jgi:FAD/FMN-containing dehydrogenase
MARKAVINPRYGSWGKFPRVSQSVDIMVNRQAGLPQIESTVLPYGRGRSYGDCCLNDNGQLLSTERLDHFISFDREHGVVVCEAGVGFEDLLSVIVPAGWFLPVTPGTQYVTVGGAIANDIHGKNHHGAGTFGRFVKSFELLRSSGERLVCSPVQNTDYFNATIAGMGLTGLITWAEIQLIKIETPMIDMESTKFTNLDEFFTFSATADKKYNYTVAWLDCVTSGEEFGRGIFMGGNHLSWQDATGLKIPLCHNEKTSNSFLSVPFDFPTWALNSYSVKAFNTLYYGKQLKKFVRKPVHYRPFFYPLDAVNNWNRIYGKNGFLQFQCVVPKTDQRLVMKELLQTIVNSGQASFLAVLKEFGAIPSPGMMSFPCEGATLALDFAHRGESTLELLRKLEAITDSAGGRLYSAKDALMSAEHFQKHYPQWERFVKFIDPKFSSSFWRRVSAQS